MKRFVSLMLAALALVVFVRAQGTSSSQSGASPPAGAPAVAGPDSLSLPADTAFTAKLVTNLDARQCKPGDPVEAQATQDVKQGKQVLLKKGSSLIGHVALAQASASAPPEIIVGIVFDGARMKNGQQQALHLVIQALAPEANVTNNDSLNDGRGLDAAASNATVSGHTTTLKGNVNQLTPASVGIYDLQGVKLGDQTTPTGHVTVLTWSKGDLGLKKGTQLVLRVVNQ